MSERLPVPSLPASIEREFPFRRRMIEAAGRRVHLVDEGNGPAVFLVHGNPTWSYLWRRVMRPLVDAGLRVVAPDLVGFGWSEKPRDGREHTISMHADTLADTMRQLELNDVIIVGQDWGGPLVAAAAYREPLRIRAGLFANTALLLPKTPIKTTWFHRFSHWPLIAPAVFYGTRFPIPIMHRVQGDPKSISGVTLEAYRLPFERWSDRAGPLALARMVPNSDDHPSMAPLKDVDQWTRGFRGPVSLVWGLRDPILGRALYRLQKAWPNAKVTETQAGHFLQEEVPELLAAEILRLAAEKNGSPA